MSFVKKIFCAIVSCFLVFNALSQSEIKDSSSLIKSLHQPNQWVDSLFSSMSVDERISQLFMLAAYSNKSKEEDEKIARLVEKYQLGGLIFFQGNPENQAKLTNKYQKLSKIPMWIGMDAETGLGMRLKNTRTYPNHLSLGAIQDDSLIYELGKQIGKECRRLGVHINFAPVMDINSNPENPVINYRSFGENRYQVSHKSIAFAQGLQSENVIAVGKHFPGHGDTDVDSHVDLPLIKHNRNRLDSLEFYPFKQSIQSDLGGVMISHLNVPMLDRNCKIATLSEPIVSQLLKEELCFNGLVFTDALNMKAIRKHYDKGKLDVKALVAGNDVLVFVEDVEKSLQEIKFALEKGELSLNQINEKCKKILRAKYWLGLHQYQPIALKKLQKDLNDRQGLVLQQKLEEQSITLLKNEQKLLPLKRLDTLKIASVAIGTSAKNDFQKLLDTYADVDSYQIGKTATKARFDQLAKSLEKYNLLIISIHGMSQQSKKQFGITNQSLEFVANLAKKKKLILDLFGNPYALDKFKNTDDLNSILISYQDNSRLQKISAQVVFGALPAKGKLPVSIHPDFLEGTGVSTEKNRLGYAFPEQVGMDALKLGKIDSIAQNAIEQKACPGCRVVVARFGSVIFDKSYGYHSYEKKNKLKPTDIYDLASLTKITATLPIVMKMVDEKRLDINSNIGKYDSKLKGSNKDTLSLKRILAHQAQLISWKPFHWEAVDSASFQDHLFSNKAHGRYSLKLSDGVYIDKNYRFKQGIFSPSKSDQYPVEVARNLYIHKNYKDTILKGILDSEYREEKVYRYSDLGFILVGEMLEKILGEPIEIYLDSLFYQKLGSKTMTYLPCKKFPLNRIVPTQNDRIFRKQWLRGYVHDPVAAMLGGVAGHAGMFGNANDLAKLAQMYLQKGEYGGERYIEAQTLNEFTSRAFPDSENRRGIGFDKAFLDKQKKGGPTSKMASEKSYGHTGFTGTMLWIDPEYELVYIFLSNRICPDDSNTKLMRMNVRTEIQDWIYKSIQKAEQTSS